MDGRLMDNENLIKLIYSRYFDHEIELLVDGKVIQSGYMIECYEKDFYFVFTILRNNKKKNLVLHVPQPFDIKIEDGFISFSYRIDDFSKNTEVLRFFRKKINHLNLRKYNFFNNHLVIRLKRLDD